MLVVAGHIRLDPAKREAAVAAAQEVMEATARESGCISYTFSADLADPGRFLIFEEWESEEALKAHFTTPHMATFQAAMGGFGIQEMNVQKYQVDSVGPLGG
ncbi:MAG: putative quinol monooxygenase [Myxococcota bacterium]